MRATDLTLTTAQAEALLSRWLGKEVRCRQIERLSGGMIHSALRLTFDLAPSSAVVKLSLEPDCAALRSEATRLAYLEAHTRLPVPAVYGYAPASDDLPYTCLLLETLPGVNLASADLSLADRRTVELELADALIELHGHTRDTFGHFDAPGTGQPSWVDLFVPGLMATRDAVREKLAPPVLSRVDAAIDATRQLLAPQGVPTLIHADVWAGNIMVAPGDDGWHLTGLVDPSGAHFADVECELSYLQVFDTVGAAFFDRYTEHHPLRPGYEGRRLCYWLHTYLVHVLFFGDPRYLERTAHTAQAILAQV